MKERKRVAILAVVFGAVVAAVGGIVVAQLYRVGFEQQQARVAEIARSRASFLGAVARFDRIESADFPGGGSAATLDQLRAGQAGFPGFGETGEYLFAHRIGDKIVFQAPLRHAPEGSRDTLPASEPVAEPMHRALEGQTGTMVGLDYRGERVLAAYRPVPELDLGLVVKIDMAEIRAPYIRAALVAGGLGAPLILLATLLITKVGGRLIARAEASEEAFRRRGDELKEALARERLAGEQLSLALEAANQGVYDVDIRTGGVQVTPEFEAMLGYEEGTLEMTYDRWVESVHPDDREFTVRFLEEYLAGERERYDPEFRMRGADGDYLWILSLGEVVERDDAGEPTRFLGTHTNITRLKEVENELLRREAHLNAAQSIGKMGSWELVPSSGRVWWSEGLYKIMGMDPNTVEPHTDRFFEKVHQEDLPRLEKKFQDMLIDSEAVDEEFRLEVNGQLRIMSGLGRVVKDSNGERRCEGVVHDITEDREMEEMLRQAQKMQAIGQLTAGIAHDFNNLLTTILANADLGLSDAGEEDVDYDVLKSEMEEIHAAARSGGKLVRQLMTFSRSESLRLQPTEMTCLMRDMSVLLQRILPENIELSVVTPDEQLMAQVDQGAVQQTILNLATNALDAMPAGGHFTLTVDSLDGSDIELDLGDDRYVRVRASDSGRGMSEEVLARAFEPFYTTKEVGEGTGLGLSMVYALMQRQDGSARISSTVGQGTTVTLFFPLDEVVTEECGSTERRQFDRARGSGRILLVEDEPALRRTGLRILERAGYEVLEAENGRKAMTILDQVDQRIDLVVSDMIMPEVGGLELLRHCRARGLSVPFMFTSGYSPADLDSSDQPGSQTFLPKPWTAREFVGAVRTAIERK